MRVNDAILGLIIIIGSILVILEARTYPALPGVPYGPGLFPTVIAAAMIFGGLLLVSKGLREKRENGWLLLEPWARKGRTYITLGLIFGSLLFYILFSERLGFLITSWCLLLALLLWTRGRGHLFSSLFISLGFPVLIYVLFAFMLRIPLPRGPIINLF